ncbi:MAG: hypothetical protein Q9186_003274 [Xanthomendoza sp. 1 TL-2023]
MPSLEASQYRTSARSRSPHSKTLKQNGDHPADIPTEKSVSLYNHQESYSPADAGNQNSYNTRSNKVRVIKTPGGKLQYQHLKKRGSPPKCGDCGIKLPGVCLKSTEAFARKSFESFRYGHELWKMALICILAIQVPALRPREYATISRPKKTVQRAYGGSRCANCVKDRVVRAFLIEEQKIVKKVLKESQQKKR